MNQIEIQKKIEEHQLDVSLVRYLEQYVEPTKLESAIDRLIEGEPVQYIVGNVDFFHSRINVNSSVLIPRFETEELVEKTVSLIQKHLSATCSIVDLGTGSGCIAIALNKTFPLSQVDAVDISENALEIAKKNASENLANIHFYCGNLFEPLKDKYDVIISNPPYIRENEPIMEIVAKNEPHVALYAEENGLYFYRMILEQAKLFLNETFIIALEIGEEQGLAVLEYAKKNFPKADSFIEQDLQKRNRFCFIIQL